MCSVCRATYRSGFHRCPRDGAVLAPAAEDPILGTVLAGRYRIERLVSEGAMGRVYLAHHVRMSRRFAVKILFGELAAQGPMRARFAQEAEAASRLEHRNLVSVVDFGESDLGLLYLVMEYIEGRTLDRILREEGTFDEERAVRITHDLCRGMRHLHARGLIHRDLKLENVVVVHDRDVEVPKIVDFGIALLPNGRDPRLTRAGVIVGTPAFMSPEQAFGDSVDARSDLFSLGIVLFHMLTGRGPFEGNAFEIIQRTISHPMPRLTDINPNAVVSPELEQIVMRLLARHPDDRFASAQGLIEALNTLPSRRELVGSAPALTPLPDLGSRSEPAPRRRSEVVERRATDSRWPWIAGAGAAVGLLVAGLAVVTLGTESEPPPAPPAVQALLPPPLPPAPELEVAPPPAPPPPPVRSKRIARRSKRRRTRAADAHPSHDRLMPLSSDVETKTRITPEPAALAASYRRVGKMIERLAEKRGNMAAASFRLRHVAIPLPASLKTDAERDQVARQLTALQHDLSVELRRFGAGR